MKKPWVATGAIVISAIFMPPGFPRLGADSVFDYRPRKVVAFFCVAFVSL
jgi:hypothetical protein